MAITKCIFQELGRQHVGALADQPMEVLVGLHLNHKRTGIVHQSVPEISQGKEIWGEGGTRG